MNDPWYKDYMYNHYSQSGEDGIISEIINRLEKNPQ